MQDPLYRNPLALEINLDWVNIPTDGSVCSECKLIIVSKNMWQLFVFVEREPIERKEKLCESCYTVLNDKRGTT